MAKFRMRGTAFDNRNEIRMGITKAKRRQLEGKCSGCNRTHAESETHAMCAECREKRTAEGRATRELRIENRQCTGCGTKNSDWATHNECEYCRAKRKAYKARLRANGQCVDCGTPSGGRRRCTACKIKERDREMRTNYYGYHGRARRGRR